MNRRPVTVAAALRQGRCVRALRRDPALVGVSGKPLDASAGRLRCRQQFVHRLSRDDRLIVAVGTGVEVGPRNGRRVPVIAHRARIDVLVVELVEQTHRSEPAQATAQVLMVAGGEHAAAVLPEPHDRIGVGIGEAVTDVDGHQPQLVVAQSVETAQDRVVVAPAGPVTRGHVMARCPQLVGEQREAGDVPIVGMRRDRGLQQDL